MQRILILIKGLGRGGAEQLVANAAPYIVRSRFEYEVAYLLPQQSALAGPLRASGLPVHCVNASAGVGCIGNLRRLIRERSIDLVHAHLPFTGIAARVALSFERRPLVYTEHSVWPLYRRPTYWANMLTFPRNDYVFAVSDQVRRSISYPVALRFMPLPPIETLYHGIDPERIPVAESGSEIRRELGIPDRVPVVGTVGNLRREKRHHDLLRAAARVHERVPDARFVFVGDGPLRQELRRHANELGLNGNVMLLGSQPDAMRLINAFDVFVLSSLYEGLSIALVEAMALGKPAVATRVGGVPEVVNHGTHGILVPPGQPNALADGILTLLRDEGLRNEMSIEARRRAGDFDIRPAVRRMEEVYEELLS